MADYTEQDGRQLAVDMLRELRREWAEQDLTAVPDEQIGEAMVSREPATLGRYLATVQSSGSAPLERGFMCVLNEFLGSMLQDFPDDCLERRYEVSPSAGTTP